MKFLYQVRTKEGNVKSGVIEASSREVAFSLLQKTGYYVTYLEEEKIPIYARELKIFRGIPSREIILFSRQLAVMLNSKIPVVESLSTIASQTKNSQLKEIASDIAEEVEAGSFLSRALFKHREIFSPFYIAMVKAGEASGKLSQCLDYLAKHLEREYRVREKIKGALIYPAMVFFLFIVIFCLMIFFVLPSFEELFKEREMEIPLLTRVVLSFSRFLKENFLPSLFVFLLPFFLAFYYSKTTKGREFFDRILLKVPFFSQISKQLILSRFSENLATLISAGLMITESLEIVADITGNEIYKEAILQIKEGVKKGSSISATSSLYPELFPPFFNQMVLVAEKTGNLASCLISVANFYQAEAERSIENFLRILEPVLIILLGGLVGGLLGTVLLPLYKIMGSY
jgi:type IV pilus assembly protein PilC